jgi:Icc protein
MAWFDECVTFATKTLKLAHITDSHLFAQHDGEYFGVNTAAHFAACLSHMATQDLDCVIFGGDLTQDHTQESYLLFAQLVEQSALNCPVFWLPGNHDDLSLLAQLSNGQISSAKRLSAVDFDILLLNSKGATPAGWVTQLHLDDISAYLALSQRQSIVFCHHNPLPINGYLDKHMLENGPQLLNVLNNSNQVNWLFHGHVHHDYNFHFRDIHVVSTPASSVQFTKNTPQWLQQNLGPAYRLITVSKSLETGSVCCEMDVIWLKE